MSILAEIFEHKHGEVAARKRAAPLAEVQAAARQAAPAPDFAAALRSRDTLRSMDTLRNRDTLHSRDALRKNRQAPALIAEIKRRSPSRGLLAPNFDPLELAHIYRDNGAAAISVLTDEHYFGGSLEFLAAVAAALPGMPLLRKDFIFDPYQVYEARAAGAGAVLLIAAGLETARLFDLHALILELGMTPLVEVHNRAELEAVLPCRPRLLGVNNRDLSDFSVRLETSLELAPLAPPGTTLVAESGIHTREDALRLAQNGFHAILVGEALVTAPDVAGRVRELAGDAPLTPAPLPRGEGKDPLPSPLGEGAGGEGGHA